MSAARYTYLKVMQETFPEKEKHVIISNLDSIFTDAAIRQLVRRRAYYADTRLEAIFMWGHAGNLPDSTLVKFASLVRAA